MVWNVIVFYSERSEEVLKSRPVLPKAGLRLKEVCCEKYKKGNRCKRCPCFDLQ